MMHQPHADARLSSAAVFAPNGQSLRQKIQPALAAIGWKVPGKWRSFDVPRWYCARVPSDYAPWSDYKAASPEGSAFDGNVTVFFESRDPRMQEGLFKEAMLLVRDQSSAFRHMHVAVSIRGGVSLDVWYKREPKSNGFSVLVNKNATTSLSSAILAPWNDCPATRCHTRGVGPVRELALGSLAALELSLRESTGQCIFFDTITPAYFAIACDAILSELTDKKNNPSLSIDFDPPSVRDLLPDVTAWIPGYFYGGFFARYRKGFDPYARPAAADAGETVRYPMVSIERPKLSPDGDKDLHIDLVHRPQGDCYFDIQVVNYNPPNDTVVRETLEDAIKPLAVKAEIWDGDPFKRWM
jgi:hypothetical protein